MSYISAEAILPKELIETNLIYSMISSTYNKCRRFLCGIPYLHIKIILITN